jgi:tripartite-type tricarboxylate transporter receptor subunit TctC
LQFDDKTHVPYKGAGPALYDLIGNHVDFYFPGFPAAAPHLKSGTLKILALSSAKRSPAAPDIPTVAEVTGNKDYDFTLWAGIFAPRGTPQAVIDRLNKEINKVIEDPDVKARRRAPLSHRWRSISSRILSRVRARNIFASSNRPG